MITDDDVMRVLEQANPASVDDPIPMLDIAGYRDVLDAEHTTMTLIDQRPAPSMPSRGRRSAILVAVAAAVVAAIALVAIRDDDATPADQPSPTVIVPPTVAPRALSDAPEELEPGTYFVDEVSGIPTPRIFVTLGAGWRRSPSPLGRYTIFNSYGGETSYGGEIVFGRPGNVFSDACHPSEGYHPGAVTTLDGLVTALTEQQGWAAVTEPSDISIDGYAGKTFQRTAPADMLECDRSLAYPRNAHDADFRSWDNPDGGGGRGEVYQLDTVETLRVVDIDGTVVVISTRHLWPTTAAARAEFAAVLDSIRIERGMKHCAATFCANSLIDSPSAVIRACPNSSLTLS